MKIYYDSEVDSLYLRLSDRQPDGVIEISAGVNLDTTPEGQLVGLEILNASQKIELDALKTWSLESEKNESAA